ncbi:MAG: diacylglycerol/lipid kinase family protein [Thermoanaerobaculia bacterium]
MKTLFLVNARSGANRRLDAAAIIRETCEWEHEIVPCGTKEELDDVIASAASRGIDVIFAVGGDGTVHEVGKRLIGSLIAFGVLPTGSGNGFARHLGVPMNLRAALGACRNLRVETIDTATINGTPFINMIGAGFDAWVADAFDKAGTRGLATYLRVGLSGLRRYEPEEYELTVDGVTTRYLAMAVVVANASQYGNNARIAPLASIQDGMLDITLIDRVSLFRLPMLAAQLVTGTFHRARGVSTMRGRSITITRHTSGAAHLDGEPVTLPETLTIEIVPRSLRVIVPDSAGVI